MLRSKNLASNSQVFSQMRKNFEPNAQVFSQMRRIFAKNAQIFEKQACFWVKNGGWVVGLYGLGKIGKKKVVKSREK